jgi:YidC/Oxa1 family membrane protein insertase
MSFLNPLYNALGYLLAFFYSLVPNLGVAIILATIVTMIVLYPLTAKQAKSMITMQRVQPEVKKLQAKYKGDRQKLNEEVMKFYQENKINPLAGCLPLVVQLPIFYVLFRVLRTPYSHVPKKGTFSQLYSTMCAGHLKSCTSSNVHHLKFIGVDLQKTATDHSLNFSSAIPYFVLVLLVVLTGYLQTKQATARTPAANKQMGTVMKVLPVFFGLISLSFPAGLVLYFLVSNTWRLGQQELIFRRLGTGASPAAGAVGKLGSPDKNGGALDVASTERVNEAKAKAAADAAREADPPPAAKRPPAAKTPPARSPETPPKSRARSANPPARRAPAARPAAQESGRGGLRGFFQLPPPPGGNGGGGRPSGAGRAGGADAKPTGSGGASRSGSPPPPRPRAKKKRKR